MRSLPLVSVAALTLTLLAPAAASAVVPDAAGAQEQTSAREVPRLVVTRAAEGFDHPWDVKSIGGGRLLVTERDSADLFVVENGARRRVEFPSEQVWVSSETGLMSLEVDPGFDDNGRFYTCQGGFLSGGGHDVRVVAWRLDDAARRATLVRTLVGGFPTTSGRHGGCRLLVTRDGSLLVGTGDGAVGTNPRDLRSLGGKTLRLNRRTGAPWPANPFIRSGNKSKRYVHTFGHRNVQGLAQRADGTLWSVEHGSFRDDEVNKLVKGGDYGWHPVPGYDESVPMTDQSLPGRQYAARWRSGNPTVAASGAVFVAGRKWGALNGTLAVAALKASRVLFMRFDSKGRLQGVRTPATLREFGRLRSISLAPNRDLLITTDGVDSGDSVLRVSPR